MIVTHWACDWVSVGYHVQSKSTVSKMISNLSVNVDVDALTTQPFEAGEAVSGVHCN